MADKAMIEVEVAYAMPHEQRLVRLQVAPGATALDAARLSLLEEHFPDLALDGCRLGIFGKVLADPTGHVLQEGERVEIYRPLLADPKEVRKRRAAKAKALRASRA